MNPLFANPFAGAGFSLGVTCLILAFITLIYSRTKVHRQLIQFNLLCASWGFGTFIVGQAQTQAVAHFGWRVACAAGIFISCSFYHFVISFCGVNRKRILKFIYYPSVLWAFSVLFSDINFPRELRLAFDSLYFIVPTRFFCIVLAGWGLVVISAFVELLRFVLATKGAKRTQSLYIFVGFLIGFSGGGSNFLPFFKIDIFYPFGNFAIVIYCFILTYAILRHRLLNIKIVFEKSVIPVFVGGVFLIASCSLLMDLNLFSLVGLCVGVSCWLLAFFVLAYSQVKMHRIWALFNIVVGAWGLGTFFIGISGSYPQALLSWRVALSGGAVFIAGLFYHVVCTFCGLQRKKLIIISYIHSFFFAFLNIFTETFVGPLKYLFNSFYYYTATPVFLIWFIGWAFYIILAFYELSRFTRKSKGIQRTQALYLLFGTLLGFAGGASTIFPAFGISVYPAWHFTICIYVLIATYAIFRFQIMDIKIVITRLGIFALVYGLALGLPFGIGFFGHEYLEKIWRHWWLVPTGLCAVFATSGPFIYFYLQRKAEERILREENRTKELLTQVSYDMTTIRQRQKLLELIVYVLAGNLKLDNAAVYLRDLENRVYVQKASKPEGKEHIKIDMDHPLIQRISGERNPIVYEEIRMLSMAQAGDKNLKESEKQMREMRASVIIPARMDRRILIGFIVLGERKDKGIYSRDLINVLSVLGNQAALAIENCNYWQAETKRMQEEGLRQRMVSLDHMASSMAHEIHNPVQIIYQVLDFIRNCLLKDPRNTMPQELNADFEDFLERGQKAAERISGMVRAISEYSRMGTGELAPIRINEAVEDFKKLIGPQIRKEITDFSIQVEDDLPLVLGEKIQVEEILVNFVRNALHAVNKKKDKKILLKIFKTAGKTVRIECSDNGYGIEKDFINDIFLSSTTTKGSTEGTGLGLYRVRKIVDLFKGKVWAESEGKDKGATLIVEFPVWEGSKE